MDLKTVISNTDVTYIGLYYLKRDFYNQLWQTPLSVINKHKLRQSIQNNCLFSTRQLSVQEYNFGKKEPPEVSPHCPASLSEESFLKMEHQAGVQSLSSVATVLRRHRSELKQLKCLNSAKQGTRTEGAAKRRCPKLL